MAMLSRLRATGFRTKLLAGISVIVVLTFCIAGIATYRIYMGLFEEEVSEQYRKASEQAMTQLEFRMQELYRISNAIVFNPTVEKAVTGLATNQIESLYDRYELQESIIEELQQVKIDAPQLQSLYLYDMNGTNYYHGLMKESAEPIGADLFAQILAKVEQSSGQLVWMNEALPSRIERSGTRDVIIASRWMRNKQLGMYGMLVMVIDEEFVSRSFREMTADGEGSVQLFDQYNRILYSSENVESGTSADSSWLTGPASRIEQEGREAVYFTRNFSPQLSFTLVSRVSMSDFLSTSRRIFNVHVLTGLISIVLSGLLIMLLSNRLLRPMKELVQGMRGIRAGRFDIRIQIRSSDELGYIAESFNAMAANVEGLIKEVYLRQISEREAELKALQAQVNPHFLYNTLNGLYWKLYLQHDLETAELVSSLSELLKYSLARVWKETTLREEARQIRNYLAIQSAFLENDFEARIEIDPEAERCLTPRFILQPLIENAFVHAFKGRSESKQLLIRAYRDRDDLWIEIADNGAGMEPERIKQVMEEETEAKERPSLGVRNVMRRIDLLYGAPYGLRMTSMPGEGTTIRLLLPYREPARGLEEGA
ncbi:cache domain-containing sensor histidine kinase [Paenibacillus methanolicus]|uniref:histidine kinase n=1 Tax=Paenibacillus methanolicus TaxID=582686 RepID=A0A5S5CDA7_9BACL|nr:sensor histidine kinase [Paenibacillus methanolicus]TYP76492.1 two-component system sensor histidine kinase YesM [Paenibacillus methanolicus]